jgi:hypothetical protein
MIHNPWSMAIGDQNDLRKEADILDGMARVLSRAYAEKTGGPVEDIRALMDSETWLYGEEIVDAGFADAMVEAGDGAESRAEAMAVAAGRVREARESIREHGKTEEPEDLVAMINVELPRPVMAAGDNAGVAGDIGEPATGDPEKPESRPAMAGESRETPMTQKELKEQHPDLYAELKREGRDEERARVSELRSYVDADPDNVKLAEVVHEAIAEGKSASEINARLQVAIRDGGKLQGENPPAVEVASESTVDLDDDDREAMRLLNMSAAEYREYKQEVM